MEDIVLNFKGACRTKMIIFMVHFSITAFKERIPDYQMQDLKFILLKLFIIVLDIIFFVIN